MFEGLFDKIIDFNGEGFRNIPTIVVSEDLLDDLSPDPLDQAYGEAAASDVKPGEDYTSPVITRPFDYGIPLSDVSHESFASRYSDGSKFGVWYGSLELLTSVYETVYHFQRRVTDMLIEFAGEVVSERRVFRVGVRGILVDLRKKYRTFPKLLDKDDYTFTHSVGVYLHDSGQRGILVESARYRSGTNVAAFTPDILSNPRHDSYLIYRWVPGQTTVRIEKPRGRTWKTISL